MADLDWYEKDLNDFDAPQVSDERENLPPKQKPCSKRLPHMIYEKTYPFDMWFRIGTYIAPEDIGRFALICRTTNHVVHTAAFWISIFKKYNKLEVSRYSRLLSREHLSIIRIHVIKCLYENYSIFQNRLNKTSVIQRDPHFLQSSRCIRIWYSERPTQPKLYNYYFQFNFHKSQPEEQIQALSSLFSGYTRYMIDKDSCILHLISSTYISIGPYMGMILSKLIFNMSSDFRYYKLKMWFDSSRVSKGSNFTVTIDPVLSLKTYKWYNIPTDLDWE